MRRIFFLIPVVLLLACTDRPSTTVTYSLKDSVIDKYIKLLDTSGQFDTADINYKILRAYISNDTIFFRKLSRDIDNARKFGLQWIEDSCVHSIKLQELNADEAYRFIYTASFCPYKLNITVSKKEDNANLHFILYQFRSDTASCRIINEYDKILTKRNWEDIRKAINTADFWGLKKENGLHGLDGDNITVIGYHNVHSSFDRRAKFNYVNRWSLAGTTLAEPFNLVLKLSGNKQGCAWIE